MVYTISSTTFDDRCFVILRKFWFFGSTLVDRWANQSRSSEILVVMPSAFHWSTNSFLRAVDGSDWETKWFGSCEGVSCRLTCLLLQVGHYHFLSWWLLRGSGLQLLIETFDAWLASYRNSVWTKNHRNFIKKHIWRQKKSNEHLNWAFIFLLRNIRS